MSQHRARWFLLIFMGFTPAGPGACEEAKEAPVKPAAGATKQAGPAKGASSPQKARDGTFGSKAEVTILWRGQSLTVPGTVKKLGQLEQRNLWIQIEALAKLARQSSDKRLQALGAWYQTLVLSHQDSRPEDVLARLKEAVELGFANPTAVEYAAELSMLRDLPEFKLLLGKLKREAEEKARKKFQAEVDLELEANLELAKKNDAADPLKLGSLKSLSGEPLWQSGQPAIIILTRIDHEGFLKQIPIIAEAHKEKCPALPVRVLFYQYSLEDSGRLAQTRKFVAKKIEKLGPQWSSAAIGREHWQGIVNEILERRKERLGGSQGSERGGDGAFTFYLPATLLVDAKGSPLYSAAGVLADWEAKHVLEKFSRAAGAEETKAPPPETPVSESPAAAKSPVPAPPPENAKGAGTEEKKAPPPEKPVSEPPAEAKSPPKAPPPDESGDDEDEDF